VLVPVSVSAIEASVSAFTATMSVSSLSIKAPADCTLVASVTSAPSSTLISVLTELAVSSSELPEPAVVLPNTLAVATLETTSTVPAGMLVKLVPSNTGEAPFTTLWSKAFTSAMLVSSLSINAPAEVTLAVSVTSAPASTPVVAPTVSPAAVPVMFVPTKSLGVPRSGVISAGESLNTSNPEPVSFEITPASCAEVVAANWSNPFEVRASPPPAGACHEHVPSPSSRKNLEPPASPVDRTAVPSGVPVNPNEAMFAGVVALSVASSC